MAPDDEAASRTTDDPSDAELSGVDLSDLYVSLRALAVRYFSQQRPDHTLQPTALVNEAFIRLAASDPRLRLDKGRFCCVAAAAMRSVLVDHARRRGAEKRGGKAKRVPLDDVVVQYEQRAIDLLALDEALTGLASVDAELTRVVELRFFGGLTEEAAAAVLGVSARTVRRHWEVARLWLRRHIEGSAAHDR